jgi:uncharacterized membrane protein
MMSVHDGMGKPTRPARPQHPALLELSRTRALSAQNRLADTITSFAGSMVFVYLHIAAFAFWMLVLERSPWPTLTLVVSLEAIFLSTFVMISQNRADEKRQVIADHAWETIQAEERQNEELLRLSDQILQLTQAIHQFTCEVAPRLSPAAEDEGRAELASTDPSSVR